MTCLRGEERGAELVGRLARSVAAHHAEVTDSTPRDPSAAWLSTQVATYMRADPQVRAPGSAA
ncbi:hypothetical protein ABT236_18775 [Streptomyces sp. NPDC001523]|uniref:hypothetical protein n=1 Tax=Streptomyces sp. NPDC001523 TaxID=3154383 RepID=UPI00331A8243